MNAKVPRKTAELLAAYLEGEVTPSERTAIERSLAEDAELRRCLSQLQKLRDVLAAPVPELEELDLVPAVRQRWQNERRQPGPQRRVPAWLQWAGAGGIAVAAALVLHVRAGGPAKEPPEEFRARSAATPGHERWTGVQVYRVDASDSRAVPLDSQLGARDGLLFSYTNLGSQGFTHLAIFGKDEAGRIFWYHPAYIDVQTDPESISIQSGVSREPLNAVVRHSYSGGALDIYAVFSYRPLRVSELERWAARSTREPVVSLGETFAVADEPWVQHVRVDVSREVPWP